jgi:hypothetical protein
MQLVMDRSARDRYNDSERSLGLMDMRKSFGIMVAREGVEPPNASLFRAAYYQRIPLVLQQLNFAGWPQFCDHSVTSADVRLSVGPISAVLLAATIGLRASPRRGPVAHQNSNPRFTSGLPVIRPELLVSLQNTQPNE